MFDIEIWLPVVGWEGRYEVSSRGRVRGIGTRSRGIRKPHPSKEGYAQVCLYERPGKTKNMLIHSLVSAAFLGPLPTGKVCCHNDGDRWCNHLFNLRYDSHKGNSADMALHGTNMPGELNHQAKLTDDAVRQILALKGSKGYREIAADFDVSFATIQKVMSRSGWKHVQILQ
jgi:NUMOD4 motif/HNH endonuclease